MDGRWVFLQLLCLTGSQIIPTSSGFSCNGSPHYCGLRFNQFTFAATHNSYSRPQSTPLKLYGDKHLPDTDCFARHQGNTVTEQLENGVRSIDIDTCSKDSFDFWEAKVITKAYSCNKVLYADPVSKILNEIDVWLKANPKEVVVLSFTEKVQRWNAKGIAKDIRKHLEDLWTPTSERLLRKNLTLNDAFKRTGEWPTLQEAIQLNQRIFLFVHPKLTSHMGEMSWVHDFTLIKQTKSKLKYQESDKCKNLISLLVERCQTDETLVSVDMFLTRGLPVCTTARADACNPLLSEVAEMCYHQRKEYNLTVNFLKIDFPDRNGNQGYKILNKVAKTLNMRNAKMFTSGNNHGDYVNAK